MHYPVILFDLSSTLVNYRGSVVGWEAMEKLGFTAVHDLLTQELGGGLVMDADLFHSRAFTRLRSAWTDTLAGRQNLHLQDLLRQALAAEGLHPAESTIAEAVAGYTAAISAGASPMTGAAELLQTLKAQGRKIGLISNTMWPGAAHHADLERFGLAQYLDVEVYSADVGLWKPSEEIFYYALNKLGGVPQHAFFVGDNPVDDIVGAHNAHMRAVWIVNREYPREAGRDADAIIDELPQLLDVLGQWEK